MDSIYIYIIAGIFAPIALALIAKAIKRIPADVRAYFVSIANYIKG